MGAPNYRVLRHMKMQAGSDPEWFVIGDIHGCIDETLELLEQAGFFFNKDLECTCYPAQRTIIQVGDLIDRGPGIDQVLKLFMGLKEVGLAEIVLGNHEDKYLRYLKGNPVKVGKSLQITIDSVVAHGKKFEAEVKEFLSSLPTVLEKDDFIVVHGAYKEGVSEKYQRNLSLYGDIDGRKDKDGYPNRLDTWKHEYKGDKNIFHGHIAGSDVDVFKTKQKTMIVNLDSGCVFGRQLSGMLYPHGDVFQVKAKKGYWEH